MNLLHILPTLERRGAQMFARRLIAGLNGKGEVKQALAVLRPGGDEVEIGAMIPALRLLPPGGEARRQPANTSASFGGQVAGAAQICAY